MSQKLSYPGIPRKMESEDVEAPKDCQNGGLNHTVLGKRKEPEGASTTESNSSSAKKAKQDNGESQFSDDTFTGNSQLVPDNSSTSAAPLSTTVAPLSTTAAPLSTIAEVEPMRSEIPAEPPKVSHKCPYCTVTMARRHDLRSHVKKHSHSIQDFVCHMCCFRTTDEKTFKDHEKDHLCKCPFCGFLGKKYHGIARHKKFCSMNPDN